MPDYIDRDAVYDAILIDGGLNAYEKVYCIDIVSKIPAEDVAPRVAASHISAGLVAVINSAPTAAPI